MKLYLNLSDRQPKQIKPMFEKTSNIPALVIFNSDTDYGKYPRSLFSLIKRMGFVERNRIFREKSFKDIETGDFIIIGENTPNENFDFQVVSSDDYLTRLNNRNFKKVYDIIDDWNTIVKKLKNTGRKEMFKSRKTSCLEDLFCRKERFIRPIGIDMTVSDSRKCKKHSKKVISYKERYQPTCREDKVTIFERWVKIGMKQYPIYVDLFGQQHIKHNSGTKLYVAEDFYGRQFLVRR